jgi:hypothetical protein
MPVHDMLAEWIKAYSPSVKSWHAQKVWDHQLLSDPDQFQAVLIRQFADRDADVPYFASILPIGISGKCTVREVEE